MSFTDSILRRKTILRLAAFWVRRVPFEFLRWRLTPLVLQAVRQGLCGSGQTTVLSRFGFRVQVDLEDRMGQFLYAVGQYERPTSLLIRSLLDTGSTFLDIGANLGYFTLLAAKHVGPGGRVIAFEPLPSAHSRLRQNVSLNEFNNCQLHRVALSNRRGTAPFFKGPEHHSGLSSLRPLESFHGVSSIKVERLDDVVSASTAVDLVKIDVEGAEVKVIQGMQNLLAAQRPELIVEVTEEFLESFSHDVGDLFGELRPLGYKMFRIQQDGLTRIRAGSDSEPGQFNALFTARQNWASQWTPFS